MPFRLVSADGQLSFELRAGLPLVLGRALSSDLPVLDPTVSRRHAELTIEPGDGVTLGAPRRSPRIQATATGGSVGLILDGRGVPIGLPRRGDDRRAVLAGWRDALEREATPSVERIA